MCIYIQKELTKYSQFIEWVLSSIHDINQHTHTHTHISLWKITHTKIWKLETTANTTNNRKQRNKWTTNWQEKKTINQKPTIYNNNNSFFDDLPSCLPSPPKKNTQHCTAPQKLLLLYFVAFHIECHFWLSGFQNTRYFYPIASRIFSIHLESGVVHNRWRPHCYWSYNFKMTELSWINQRHKPKNIHILQISSGPQILQRFLFTRPNNF